jgi:hypothetical protein
VPADDPDAVTAVITQSSARAIVFDDDVRDGLPLTQFILVRPDKSAMRTPHRPAAIRWGTLYLP